MQQYKNESSTPLSLAVWLATDEYDHNYDPRVISVTGLIKPVKEIILAGRIPPDDVELPEIGKLAASRMGTAIHNGIEGAWVNNYSNALTSLGYPQSLIDRIVINPINESVLAENSIPIYLERRTNKEINGFTISGKFDFVSEGRVRDFKSTSTYSYIKKSNNHKYAMQGSIYRWLNQDIIVDDHMAIDFIFTDWKAGQAYPGANYPPSKVMEMIVPLMSVPETEHYISSKLAQIELYMDADEADIPTCTDKELSRDAPSFKYYKNPQKTVKSTKNFDNINDANLRLAQDGNVGFVKTVPGNIGSCKFCNAAPICKQKDHYIADGSLKL